MDPASEPVRARRPLRRVVLGSLAGIAWLALSASVASADDAATPAPAAGATVPVVITVPAGTGPATDVPAPSDAVAETADGAAAAGRAAGETPWSTVPAADPTVDPTAGPTVEPAPDPTGPPPSPPAPPVPAVDPALPVGVPGATVPVTAPVVGSALPVAAPVPAPGIPVPAPAIPVTAPGIPGPVPADRAATDPAPAKPAAIEPLVPAKASATDPVLLTKPAAADSLPLTKPVVKELGRSDGALPGPVTASADPVSAGASRVSAAAKAAEESRATPRPAPTALRAEVYPRASYLPLLDTAVRPRVDGQPAGGVPGSVPGGSVPGGSTPPAPGGKDHRDPWPAGKNLPAPDALPAAPGSGSGNTLTSGGPSGGAAWLPSLYLIIPTAAAEPVRGPLQHAHSAAAADPGSSPD